MIKQVFQHYGAREFKKDLFLPIEQPFPEIKPTGGLWASPLDSKNNWYDWATRMTSRQYEEDNYFTFELSSNARILLLDSLEDIEKVPLIPLDKYPKEVRKTFEIAPIVMGLLVPPDYTLLSESYDAIWLTEEGLADSKHCMTHFESWDVETLFVMNPDIMILD